MTSQLAADRSEVEHHGFNPAAAELIGKAAGLRPLLERNAAQGELDGRVPAENITALDELNLTALTLPKRFGGIEASLTTACRILEELGKGDASTAWVTMIQFHSTHSIITAPSDVRDDIFSVPVKRVSAVGASLGSVVVEKVEGGWSLSGKWGFATGSHHAQWILLLGNPVFVDEQMIGFVDVYLPIEAVTIVPTWDVAGMSATGSNSVILDNLFVPSERSRYNDMETFAALNDVGQGGSASDNLALLPTLVLSQLAVGLGVAQAMLDLVIARAPKRAITRTMYLTQVDSPVAMHDIAKAALKINSVRAQLYDASAEVDRWAEAGEMMPMLERTRIRGLGGYAMEVLRDAADMLMEQGGASGFAKSDPLQRQWRDLNTLSRHAVTATAISIEIYARALFGQEPNITQML